MQPAMGRSALLVHAPGNGHQRQPSSARFVAAQAKKGVKQGSRGRDSRRGTPTIPDGPARPPLPPNNIMQGVNFDAIESIEVQGNKVILTMDENEQNNEQGEAQLEEEMQVMDAVVKIFCVHTEPNYSLPWQRKRQFSSTSSGFMVQTADGKKWLLTNAHSVEYHSQVKVKVNIFKNIYRSSLKRA